jgi:hypothetical protein
MRQNHLPPAGHSHHCQRLAGTGSGKSDRRTVTVHHVLTAIQHGRQLHGPGAGGAAVARPRAGPAAWLTYFPHSNPKTLKEHLLTQ